MSQPGEPAVWNTLVGYFIFRIAEDSSIKVAGHGTGDLCDRGKPLGGDASTGRKRQIIEIAKSSAGMKRRLGDSDVGYV